MPIPSQQEIALFATDYLAFDSVRQARRALIEGAPAGTPLTSAAYHALERLEEMESQLLAAVNMFLRVNYDFEIGDAVELALSRQGRADETPRIQRMTVDALSFPARRSIRVQGRKLKADGSVGRSAVDELMHFPEVPDWCTVRKLRSVTP